MPDPDTDDRCECELPGPYCCGVPGILAWLEAGRPALGAGVERCDLCQRYASDVEAESKLRELGLFHANDPRAGKGNMQSSESGTPNSPTERNPMPRILLINNLGGGYADYVDVAPGTTVEELFEKRVGGNAEDYLIRANRQPVAQDQVLQEGDRVSITPVKIEGA